ncbi:FadR/GntR family transcriptional regulator [Aestuariimicrobium sp. Y1814]|uniref:FadR/GntR family transcriptional regulator n=1 Tax=Aestuariimicrobium sp. Y1814 TaxID=3418742 RepID=UPI003DA73794
MHDAVLTGIGLEITSGVHRPGEALTLEQLQDRFGVSRTVVREAMRMLESLGLVAPRRRVGLVVQPMGCWRVLDTRVIRWRLDGPGRSEQLATLTELRLAIEPIAAAGAAERASVEQRARLVELAAQLRTLGEAGRIEEFLAADVDYHALLLQASGNEMFSSLTGVVGEVLAGRTEHGLMPRCPRPEALDLHERVAAAVQIGEVLGAEVSMRELLTEVQEAIGADGEGGHSGNATPPSANDPGPLA